MVARYSMLPLLHLVVLLTQVTVSHAINYPVILVPGDGGTRIEAKLVDVPNVPHFLCKKSTEGKYIVMWLSIERLLPFFVDCLVHNMRLHYDNVTHTTNDTEGVHLRIRGWGNTETIDWLDTVHIPKSKYYNDMSDYLEGLGYKRGTSLRGIPYDFRKSPNEMEDLLKRTKLLIEETYVINGNKSCVLIGHSMGNPIMLYFLNKASQAWKDKYVAAFVALAGPWGGAIKSLLTMISGFNFHAPDILLSSLSLRPLQRSMTSSAWLLPSPDFWNQSETLVETPQKSYTTKDYKQLFNDLNYNVGYLMRKDTENLIRPLTPPGVTVHCLHGRGVYTRASLKYTKKTWPNGEPTSDADDGDGTVNIRSLRGCLRWKGAQKQDVFHKEFQGVEHIQLIQYEGTFSYIKGVLFPNGTQDAGSAAIQCASAQSVMFIQIISLVLFFN